LKSGAIEGVSG
jgi:probable HAF family extracellular repeat protein